MEYITMVGIMVQLDSSPLNKSLQAKHRVEKCNCLDIKLLFIFILLLVFNKIEFLAYNSKNSPVIFVS